MGVLVRGFRCATSCCDLDLTFDIAVVTLIIKILSRLYLRYCKKLRDASLCMGDLQAPPAPHFVFLITL